MPSTGPYGGNMNATERDQMKKRLEQLAWLMDSSIPLPGLRARIGIDPLIGLIPGFGDTVGALISSYIIAQAARLGAPRSILIKMAFNVATDTIIGAIPGVGDLFDFGWKGKPAQCTASCELRGAAPQGSRNQPSVCAASRSVPARVHCVRGGGCRPGWRG